MDGDEAYSKNQQTNMYGTVTAIEEQLFNLVVWVRSDTEETPFPQQVGFPTRGEFAETPQEVLAAQLAERALVLEVGQEVTISYFLMSGQGETNAWRMGTGLS